jgi:pimeloyl-ACP methyl ester carboxylesterase
MKSLLLVFISLYMLLLGYLYLAQRSFIYFPSFTRPVAVAPNYELTNEDLLLKGWVLNEDKDNAILYFGGNGERLEYNLPQFRKIFPDSAVYMLSYRGYGDSEGEPTEQGIYSDALALYTKVRAKHGAVSVIGRSLGSAVATYVAANRVTDKIALITPFSSILDIAKRQFPIFPVTLLLKDRYLSVERAGQIVSNVLVIYAENDMVVAESSTKQLIAGFTPEYVDVVKIEGAGHNTVSEYAEYEEKLQDFFKLAPSKILQQEK